MPFSFQCLQLNCQLALLKVSNFKSGGKIVRGKQEKERHVPHPKLLIQRFYLELCFLKL